MSRQGLGQLLDVHKRLAKDNLPAGSAHEFGLQTGWARPFGRPGHRSGFAAAHLALARSPIAASMPATTKDLLSRAIERCQKGAATPAQLRGPCRRQWASLGGGCSRGRSPSLALASWAGPAPSASALGSVAIWGWEPLGHSPLRGGSGMLWKIGTTCSRPRDYLASKVEQEIAAKLTKNSA